VSSAVLAVSLEPPGGSPTGAPTGPVIATGKLTNL
jgi:anti-sigma-K factor RskA